MDKEKIYKQLNIYANILKEKGYNLLYMGLYGSQNYNLDDEHSDIDVRAIILPSLYDIIFKKSTSIVIETEQGSIDVKDLITYNGVIQKGNCAFIEPIKTQYFIGDKKIRDLFKDSVVNLKSVIGMAYEKRKALDHEYPSKESEFSKWGFDPKQYHHILRLRDLLVYNITTDFFNQKSYLEYNINNNREILIDIKRNKNNLSLNYVKEHCDDVISYMSKLLGGNECYLEFVKNYDDTKVYNYLLNKIKLNLFNDNTTNFCRQVRTFNNEIPKADLQKFKELEKYIGKDISYIVYETLEIL
jgi:hypothetical protein